MSAEQAASRAGGDVTDDEPIRFVNCFGRNVATAGGCGFVALFAWAIAVDAREVPEAQIFAGVLLACSVFITLRAVRGFTVKADAEKVLVSTFLRQHRLRWRDIQNFERDTGTVGALRRDYLVVIKRDESRQDFGREINSKPGSATRPSSIDVLVGRLELERVRQCSRPL